MEYTPDEIVERGQAIYEHQIRAQIEPTHNGEFLIINIETGEFEMDADDLTASKRAKARFPGAALFTMRVGHSAAYRLGRRYVANSE